MYLIAKQRKEVAGIYKGLIKTILFNHRGIIKAVIPANKEQPTLKHNIITINNYNYHLIFKEDG